MDMTHDYAAHEAVRTAADPAIVERFRDYIRQHTPVPEEVLHIQQDYAELRQAFEGLQDYIERSRSPFDPSLADPVHYAAAVIERAIENSKFVRAKLYAIHRFQTDLAASGLPSEVQAELLAEAQIKIYSEKGEPRVRSM